MIIVLNYKGYEGIIQCSESSQCYCGYVRGLSGCPEFRGGTPTEVIQDFRDCVDFHTARLEKEINSRH